MLGNDNAYIGGLMGNVPKMRGLAEAINELLNYDPTSGFTLHALRKAVKEGKIPCVHCGRKILVNMDNLFAYLYGGESARDDKPKHGRVIAPIR